MPDIGDLEKYVGIIALACFGGTFLGGMLLSYFWKVFGPWKMLEEAKNELQKCETHRLESNLAQLRQTAELADVNARFDVLREAIVRSGFELQIDKIGGHR